MKSLPYNFITSSSVFCHLLFVKSSIHNALNKNTLFVGQIFLELPTLDSTNSFAADYLSKNNPSEGTVISTPNQTAGRGQIGSAWESAPHQNISLSVILYPKFLRPNEQFYLSKIIGLAVKSFLEDYITDDIFVKWPNDIYIQNKKIAGILIQNSLAHHQIKHSIIGIGININQEIFLSDAPNPISLKLLTQKDFNLKSLNQNLCWHVEKWYLRLKSNQQNAIDKAYQAALYKKGENRKFEEVATQMVFEGTIVGTSSSGKLQIVTSSGIREFNMKEVKFL